MIWKERDYSVCERMKDYKGEEEPQAPEGSEGRQTRVEIAAPIIKSK